MKCKAQYVGAQSDCGYEYNKIYKIKVKIHKKLLIVESKHCYPKAYTSFIKMFEDWNFTIE